MMRGGSRFRNLILRVQFPKLRDNFLLLPIDHTPGTFLALPQHYSFFADDFLRCTVVTLRPDAFDEGSSSAGAEYSPFATVYPRVHEFIAEFTRHTMELTWNTEEKFKSWSILHEQRWNNRDNPDRWILLTHDGAARHELQLPPRSQIVQFSGRQIVAFNLGDYQIYLLPEEFEGSQSGIGAPFVPPLISRSGSFPSAKASPQAGTTTGNSADIFSHSVVMGHAAGRRINNGCNSVAVNQHFLASVEGGSIYITSRRDKSIVGSLELSANERGRYAKPTLAFHGETNLLVGINDKIYLVDLNSTDAKLQQRTLDRKRSFILLDEGGAEPRPAASTETNPFFELSELLAAEDCFPACKTVSMSGEFRAQLWFDPNSSKPINTSIGKFLGLQTVDSTHCGYRWTADAQTPSPSQYQRIRRDRNQDRTEAVKAEFQIRGRVVVAIEQRDSTTGEWKPIEADVEAFRGHLSEFEPR